MYENLDDFIADRVFAPLGKQLFADKGVFKYERRYGAGGLFQLGEDDGLHVPVQVGFGRQVWKSERVSHE